MYCGFLDEREVEGRVAETADQVFAALEPNCRTIVVNAAERFGQPRPQKCQNSLQRRRFGVVEMGLEPPALYMRSKRRSK